MLELGAVKTGNQPHTPRFSQEKLHTKFYSPQTSRLSLRSLRKKVVTRKAHRANLTTYFFKKDGCMYSRLRFFNHWGYNKMLLQWNRYQLFPFNFTIYLAQLLLYTVFKEENKQVYLYSSTETRRKNRMFPSPGILLSLGNILFFLHFQNILSLQPNWSFSALLPELLFCDCQCLELNRMEHMKRGTQLVCWVCFLSLLHSQKE